MEQFIIELLETQYNFPKIPLEEAKNINFIAEAYVDSLELIQFVVDIEEKYNIEFLPDDLTNPEFGNIAYLVQLIQEKINKGEIL